MANALLLNLTTFCQAKCPFCIVYDSLNRPELNMTDEQIFSAIRQAREQGSTQLGYTGGEPAIHPRIIEIVRFAKDLGFTHQSMNTNGIRFKQAKFTQEIIEAGLTSVDISIHGHTDELHDELVAKKGALAAIREACQHLTALQKRHRFNLSATVVIARRNHPHLREVCEFLDGLGIGNKRLKYAYEGNMTREAIIEQVAPYDDVVPSVIDALDYLASQPKGFHLTHIPLCLLGDHAAFSQDFERRVSLMVFKQVQKLGDAQHYFRKDGDTCSSCAVSHLCTRLDGGYEKFHGRPRLKPFTSHEEVEALFERAEKRFPISREHVRKHRRVYRENREGFLPKTEVVQKEERPTGSG